MDICGYFNDIPIRNISEEIKPFCFAKCCIELNVRTIWGRTRLGSEAGVAQGLALTVKRISKSNSRLLEGVKLHIQRAGPLQRKNLTVYLAKLMRKLTNRCFCGMLL